MTQPPQLPPTPPAWRVVRPLVAAILVVVVALGLVAVAGDVGKRIGAGLGSEDTTVGTALEAGLEVEVDVPSGANARDIGRILVDAGLVASASQFETAVRAAGVDATLQSGTYRLLSGMTIQEIIDELRAGPRVVVFDVTVREGLRVGEIIDVLAEASGIDRTEFTDAIAAGEVHSDLADIPAEATPRDLEGLLFPDTYRFSEDATAGDMLQRLANTMQERMDEVDWTDLEAAGYTQYDGIVIASLIESEVRVAAERPLVSSVIRNRLSDGVRLDIDATVLYALGTRDPAAIDITVDSPYNTRLVDGLPPGPICAPGLASLEAAAHPADTEYRYYVLSSEDGSHAFATTLEEHNANVAAAREAGVIP